MEDFRDKDVVIVAAATRRSTDANLQPVAKSLTLGIVAMLPRRAAFGQGDA